VVFFVLLRQVGTYMRKRSYSPFYLSGQSAVQLPDCRCLHAEGVFADCCVLVSCALSLSACDSIRDARAFLFLSIVGHYSLFPLLFKPTGQLRNLSSQLTALIGIGTDLSILLCACAFALQRPH